MKPLRVILPLWTWLSWTKSLQKAWGDTFLIDWAETYFRVVSTRDSDGEYRTAKSYLRLFQELNAHSVYHLLPTVTQPCLDISGYLDPLTPSMQSNELVRRLPNATHYCDPLSSHVTILESPDWCVAEVKCFLDKCAAVKMKSE